MRTYFFIAAVMVAVGGIIFGYAARAALLPTSVTVSVIPGAPSNLAATAFTDHALLSWSDNSTNEDSFVVQRGGDGVIFSTIGTAPQNAVSFSDPGVNPGLTYYYRVFATNVNGNSAFSNIASTTIPAQTTTTPPVASGGGGGGAFYPSIYATGAKFRGRAYPDSSVSLLKDGQIAAVTTAGPDANFEIDLSGLTPGTDTFGLWSEDHDGNKSVTRAFTVTLTSGATTIISGIFLAPTISIDKTTIRRGDVLTVLGQSVPDAHVTVVFNSDTNLIKKTVADKSGNWRYSLSSLELEYGDHTTKAQAASEDDISTFSQLLRFIVGTSTVSALPVREKGPFRGDLNGDGKVNLIDFSILAYWYKRPSPPLRVDLNADKEITIKDFSILAFYWTG